MNLDPALPTREIVRLKIASPTGACYVCSFKLPLLLAVARFGRLHQGSSVFIDESAYHHSDVGRDSWLLLHREVATRGFIRSAIPPHKRW